MGLKSLKVFRWASIIAIVTLVSLVSLTTYAQTPEGTISLAVSPQILDLTANPGETSTNTFRLTNASAQAVDIRATPKNFTPRGEEGAVDLTVDDTTFSLAEWITVSPARTTIQPGKTQDFIVDINVTADAEPGSHFGSVVFQSIPPEQEGSAALVSQEIAPVILIKVAGDVQESAEIAEFTSGKSTYSNEKTIELLSRIENTGSVHFKPKGIITIKNMFGGEVAELDIDKRNVLPASIRQIPTEWQPEGFQIGKYTATLTIVYGDNDEIRVAETSFIIFPYQTVLPITIGVVVLVIVGIKFRKRLALAAKVLSGKDQPKE